MWRTCGGTYGEVHMQKLPGEALVMSTGRRGEEGRLGMQTSAKRSEHITWLCAHDRGTDHCWTTGRTSWVKRRKKRGKEKRTVGTVLWFVDGWQATARPETAAMGSRVGRGASFIHLVEEISFADKIYYT